MQFLPSHIEIPHLGVTISLSIIERHFVFSGVKHQKFFILSVCLDKHYEERVLGGAKRGQKRVFLEGVSGS